MCLRKIKMSKFKNYKHSCAKSISSYYEQLTHDISCFFCVFVFFSNHKHFEHNRAYMYIIKTIIESSSNVSYLTNLWQNCAVVHTCTESAHTAAQKLSFTPVWQQTGYMASGDFFFQQGKKKTLMLLIKLERLQLCDSQVFFIVVGKVMYHYLSLQPHSAHSNRCLL